MTASTLFFLLFVRACPLMMMLIMRGGHGHGGHAHGHGGGRGHDHGDSASEHKTAAQLRRERDELDRLIEERERTELGDTLPGYMGEGARR